MCTHKLEPRVSGGPYVICREDKRRKRWRQYFVIAPPVTSVPALILHCEPALLGGWRFTHIDYQSTDDWPNMTPEQILAFKEQSASNDGCVRDITAHERGQVLAWLENELRRILALAINDYNNG